MGRSQKNKLTPATRLCAMTTLVVWLAALVFCSAECFFGGSQCQPRHHEEQTAASHHEHEHAPDSDEHNDCPNTICDSLKNFVLSTSSSFVAKSNFSLTYVLNFVSSCTASKAAGSETPIFRQAWRRDWAFTPEVCLGPAFRSHAPPVLS